MDKRLRCDCPYIPKRPAPHEYVHASSRLVFPGTVPYFPFGHTNGHATVSVVPPEKDPYFQVHSACHKQI